MRAQKTPSPSPHTPPKAQGFIVYMSIASTKLVVCKRSVKTCRVVIYSIYDEKTSKSPVRIGLGQAHVGVNPTQTGGGQSDPHPYKSTPNTRNPKNRKMGTQKTPSPSPHTPPKAQGFIVYTSIASTKLVERKRSVKTYGFVISLRYHKKTSK